MAYDAHGHEAIGGDHVPHILPLRAYLATWGTLMVLTAITVWASYQHFGDWNLVIALTIATIKAITVGAIFMHLYFDHKFHSIIFASSLIFLGIFIWFTMYDTEARGQADAVQADKPVEIDRPWYKKRSEELVQEKYGEDKLPPPATPPR